MQRTQADQVAELVERYGRAAFTTAYRILGNAEDADDALQEAFLRLLRRDRGSEVSDEVRDWGAYLKTVTARCAIDVLRSRSKRPAENAEAIDLVESDDGNPSRAASQEEKVAMLRKALSLMPERDAQVFSLRCFDDLSYEAIAAQMNLSVGQVGVILHRTRNRLRDMFQPQVGNALPRMKRGNHDVGAA